MKSKLMLVSITWYIVLSISSAIAAELILFSQPGCEYCERWREEVGIIYSKTEEAKIARLHEFDIDEKLPEKYSTSKPIIFTPTFVVFNQGKEVDRILGYISEDFFWGHLNQILEKLPKS